MGFQSRGFTLLELLVVLFIIGIITAMATLSIGVASRETGVEKEIDRIADLLALASEEAVLQGRELGVTFYTKEYEFSNFDVSTYRWIPLGDDAEPLSPRRFPPEAVVNLEIEGRLVKLPEEKPQQKQGKTQGPDGNQPDRVRLPANKDVNAPQVFILSSGDITPFTLRLRPAIGRPGISLKVSESGTVERVRDEP